ncbi:MAG: phosphoribosylformylglycinamidine synthase subunit PurQ [candidate division NC10 bacterium]|jgi:phosphoribosylformylglycinamidine synthase|nr:phosphoribosylformylglycinamidine synthase subunit PurQ [candidate division NC10 bacterium]
MRFGIIVFPGSNCELDCRWVLENVLGQQAELVWHKETALGDYDCLILPGGFAHGDYLRTGAIARFSPVMAAVERHARRGGLVLGICNGFQVLCEAGLLPGALLRNTTMHFLCRQVHIRVETAATPFTNACTRGQVLRIPINHNEGRYYADEATIARLTANDQVVFRYVTAGGEPTEAANPNGSLQNIAGICNEGRNVLGLMPHPERAAEALLGSADGRLLFASVLRSARTASATPR